METNRDYTYIKPHHFLDFLYDLAVDRRHQIDENSFGNNNGLLCNAFMDGQMRKICFTPFADDICGPCKKLIDGKRCTDWFDDETTLYYGFRYKNDFNYQLDLRLNDALPDVFVFDKVYEMPEILNLLKENLTSEIISYYRWNRKNRIENTFIGIDKALAIYGKR